jgi:methionyl-tRNA formyltransferase
LTLADAQIDWMRRAADIDRQVRALTARMPATTWLADERIRVLEAEAATAVDGRPGELLAADRDGLTVRCGEGALRIKRLQLSRGKGRPLSAADALNGYPALFQPGIVLRNA